MTRPKTSRNQLAQDNHNLRAVVFGPPPGVSDDEWSRFRRQMSAPEMVGLVEMVKQQAFQRAKDAGVLGDDSESG